MSDTKPPNPDSPTEQPARARNDLWTWIGIVAGGWTLLALIDEISPMVIHGKLRAWVDAYSLLVGGISEFLFGWINFEWLQVHAVEQHIIVLSSITFGVLARSAVQGRRLGLTFGFMEEHLGDLPPIRFVIFGVLWGVASMIWFSLIFHHVITTIIAVVTVGGVVTESLQDNEVVDRKTIGRVYLVQAANILLVAAVLVFLNYTLFRYLWT